MSYTYPGPPVTVTSGEALNVHHLMKTPGAIAKRLRTLLDYKFFSDFLLTGRYTAQGGAILYETGEEIFPVDSPEAIEAGAEYPLTSMTTGELATAKVTKWGQDTVVTDEAISRLNIAPVNAALSKISNGMVRHVDGIAMAVIASKVVNTYSASGAAWTTAGNIIEGVLGAEAQMVNLLDGFAPDTVILKGAQYAKIMGIFALAGLLPREGANPVLSGLWPNLLGKTWVTNPNYTSATPMLVDRDRLGGMADENIGSPGYSSGSGAGVEVKVMRQDETDSYRLRGRRVTVPVVLEHAAALTITGTGLS